MPQRCPVQQAAFNLLGALSWGSSDLAEAQDGGSAEGQRVATDMHYPPPPMPSAPSAPEFIILDDGLVN